MRSRGWRSQTPPNIMYAMVSMLSIGSDSMSAIKRWEPRSPARSGKMLWDQSTSGKGKGCSPITRSWYSQAA